MKSTVIILFFMIESLVFGQSQYYKLVLDKNTYNQKEYDEYFNKLRNDLPKDYSITPICFHKVVLKDSIINYVRFNKIWSSNMKIDPHNFDPVYKEDTFYYFLDRKLPEFKLKDV